MRPVILVSSVGAVTGSKAAAAALACAGSEPDRAGILIDLAGGRPSRPSLIATAAARTLEERLAVHLPEAGVASRGATCHLSLAADASGVEQIAAALPLVRDSLGVIYLPPRLLQPALVETGNSATGALLVADLKRDRALTALAVRDLLDRGLRVAVLKRPLGWFVGRAALLGALPAGAEVLPMRGRLLGFDDSKFHQCYDGEDESEDERHENPQRERQGPARARRWPERQDPNEGQGWG